MRRAEDQPSRPASVLVIAARRARFRTGGSPGVGARDTEAPSAPACASASVAARLVGRVGGRRGSDPVITGPATVQAAWSPVSRGARTATRGATGRALVGATSGPGTAAGVAPGITRAIAVSTPVKAARDPSQAGAFRPRRGAGATGGACSMLARAGRRSLTASAAPNGRVAAKDAALLERRREDPV